MLAVIARAFGDLCGQFARRGEHERTRRADAAVRGVGNQPLQYGQHEAGGFAGAGLRAGQHVAAGKHRGDRLYLDGRGRVVAFIGDSTQQFGQ